MSEDEEEIGGNWILSEWEQRVADMNARQLGSGQLPTNRSGPLSRQRPTPHLAWDVLDGKWEGKCGLCTIISLEGRKVRIRSCPAIPPASFLPSGKTLF